MRIGIVSDTHGRFDPALPRLFRGVDLIIHTGDIGTRSTRTRYPSPGSAGS